MAMKLPIGKTGIPMASMRRLPTPPKQADKVYHTPEYRAWREAVIARAGRRCQAVDDHGRRCWKAEPGHRMFADHIMELRDGGEPFDLSNGQCLCGSHHVAKTASARAIRRFT